MRNDVLVVKKGLLGPSDGCLGEGQNISHVETL